MVTKMRPTPATRPRRLIGRREARSPTLLTLNMRILTITTLFATLVACRNYDSVGYRSMEDKAICDILPAILKEYRILDDDVALSAQDYKVYVYSTLDTSIYIQDAPGGFAVGWDGQMFSDERIREAELEYDSLVAAHEDEEDRFWALRSGQLAPRTWNPKCNNLQLRVIPVEADTLRERKFDENTLGYIKISRVIVNRFKTTGYLSYTVFAGEAFAYSNNIQIKNIGGVWTVTDQYSGWVS